MASADDARQAAAGTAAGLNVSRVQARKMVLVGTLAFAAIQIYRTRAGGGRERDENTYRRMWGVGVVGLLLALLADFAPQIAGPFAAVLVLGSLTNGGEQTISNALGKVSRPAASTPHPTRPGGESPGGPRRQ